MLLLAQMGLLGFAFAQGSPVLIPDYDQLGKPDMTALEIKSGQGTIDIPYESYNIIIRTDLEPNQKIVITKDNELIFQEELKYPFDARYLHGAYTIALGKTKVKYLLISSFFIGASGFAANMTHGLLLYFDGVKAIAQTLSTWGLLEQNFINVGHDVEFVSIDFIQRGRAEIFIPNYFSFSTKDHLAINVSSTNNVSYYTIEQGNGFWTKGESEDIELLKMPDMFRK